MKTALITGISGQDGSYLAEHLLNNDYKVYGMVRRHSVSENQSSRLNHIFDQVELLYGDMIDPHNVYNMIRTIRPDEVYHLAAQSHVQISSDVPGYTIQANAVGTLNILEAIRMLKPDTKLYNAASSEMFGNACDNDGAQRLSTPKEPVSPYGCSKLLAYNLTKHYRVAYNMFMCSGILFNHESPRRGSNFVTSKVVKGAVAIKRGEATELVLGNMDACRDWGHSKDFVKAMHLILNHSVARDWVVATGITHTVRHLVETVFNHLDLNYHDYVKTSDKFCRPQELEYLRGSSSEIRETLGWKPQYSFETMIVEMITQEMNKGSNS